MAAKKENILKRRMYIMSNFKTIMEYRKRLDAPSQFQIAYEIRKISTTPIGFNQSMVSHMFNSVDVPKCDKTLSAIMEWIDQELKK